MQLVFIPLRVFDVFEDKDCVTMNAFRGFFHSETTIQLVTYTLHTYIIKVQVARTNNFVMKLLPLQVILTLFFLRTFIVMKVRRET